MKAKSTSYATRFKTSLHLKKTVLVLVCFAFLFSADPLCFGQTTENKSKEEPVYENADKMPLFNGKEAGEFSSWIAKEIKYPVQAIQQKIKGMVTVSFIVEKDGSVSTVKVVKSVPALDEEAVRVVKSSPKWTPGMNANKVVRVKFVVPINFRTTFPSDEKLRIK